MAGLPQFADIQFESQGRTPDFALLHFCMHTIPGWDDQLIARVSSFLIISTLIDSRHIYRSCRWSPDGMTPSNRFGQIQP